MLWSVTIARGVFCHKLCVCALLSNLPTRIGDKSTWGAELKVMRLWKTYRRVRLRVFIKLFDHHVHEERVSLRESSCNSLIKQ